MKATVVKSPFGKLPSGRAADLFTLTNAHGLVARITNYGAMLTELRVPDRTGRLGNVVCGFDNLGQYLKDHPYFGCTVGRVANRIAGGQFTLDGKHYSLAVNNGPNALHGGIRGFDKVLWKAEPLRGATVRFSYTSADGEEGYPGKLAVIVCMKLTDANEFLISYTATTNKPTPINLTNHSYFNLAGQGDIKAHKLTIAADFYTPKSPTNVPTGEVRPVRGTPLNFTRPTTVGARFAELGGKPQGYDHNFVLRGDATNSGQPAFCARVVEPRSGRVMEVFTTEPGVQLYTANWLDGSLIGRDGVVYVRHCGLCLEAQHFPNSIHIPHFPNTVLRPGETYHQLTIHRFSTS
ncbi:MAG TPA: aldose epimerase family protein [Candidatus Paceibacterota bacterium]|nr:aldose epimerase family protein [Verrucomicrobiota bacterium]HSA12644.1 aldose epimerase family protein [Candidatus Paceibacterota bacterium]